MKPATLMIMQSFHFQKTHFPFSGKKKKISLHSLHRSTHLICVIAVSRLQQWKNKGGFQGCLCCGVRFLEAPHFRVGPLAIACLAHPAGCDGGECVPSGDRLQKRNSFVLQTCSCAVLKSFIYLFMPLLIMIITSCSSRRDHVPLFLPVHVLTCLSSLFSD